MELRQVQNQILKLKMTPELRQAISILQFSSQELSDFIHEQALENPIIELRESEGILDYSRIKPYRGKSEGFDPIGRIVSQEANLKDDLLQQARLFSLNSDIFQIVSYLIMQLDEDGYLRDDLDIISNECHQSSDMVLKALKILQTFEPAGIGAMNLEECLLLQITPDDDLARQLITNHLVDIARGDLGVIQEHLNVSLEDIKKAIALIQSLNPKPGNTEITKRSEYIRPDLVVEKTVSGYDVWLVENGIPSVHANHDYDHFINSAEKNDTTSYVHQKYRQFQWLVKSIEQRRTTLLKVARSIMNHQMRFLEWGPKAMAPLTLREIANELEIHESTVSRAVKQKYVQTPYGIFGLKTFFTSKIKATGVRNISSTGVKILIKDLIETEDIKDPLSDQKIVDVLKNTKGIDISRRAIAKYRNALNIPASSKRKSFL